MDLVDWLQHLSEPELYPIVEELLRAMGYRRVEPVHGPTEVGKDIVFAEEDRVHRQLWRAAQVKIKLSGKAGLVATPFWRFINAKLHSGIYIRRPPAAYLSRKFG